MNYQLNFEHFVYNIEGHIIFEKKQNFWLAKALL